MALVTRHWTRSEGSRSLGAEQNSRFSRRFSYLRLQVVLPWRKWVEIPIDQPIDFVLISAVASDATRCDAP